MIKDIWNCWTDSFNDGPLPAFLAVLTFVIAGIIGCCAAYFAFYLADSSFMPKVEYPAVVESKSFQPSWTQVIIHNDGKTSWTQVIIHPDSWRAYVKIGNESDGCEISHSTYEAINQGSRVTATTQRGRISRKLYVVHISP